MKHLSTVGPPINSALISRIYTSINTGNKADALNVRRIKRLNLSASDRHTSQMNKTPKFVPVGCIGLWKHNSVLSEFGKIRESGKMCHVISIDEQVTCLGWFDVLMTEFILWSQGWS